MSEERAQVKEKKEEELHPFLTIKVITDESFSNHQGFGLAVFDKIDKKNPPLSNPPAFHIPKQTTYGTFKSKIDKHFNYHESRIRLWVLENRQNKTLRPDVCIPDNEPSSSMLHEFHVGCF